MMKSDFTTFDLGQTCLRLKDGLRFSIQQGKHGCWYLIEDDSRGKFFRIGATEYTFLSVLDGTDHTLFCSGYNLFAPGSQSTW